MNPTLHVAQVATPFGPAVVAMFEDAIVEWWFTTFENARLELHTRWPEAVWEEDSQTVKQHIHDLFSDQKKISVRLLLKGTDFQVSVWKSLLTIPVGQTVSYGELALRLGRPSAVRAVAHAVGKNPISYLLACHRVLPVNRSIGQYRWGSDIKALLLRSENAFFVET